MTNVGLFKFFVIIVKSSILLIAFYILLKTLIYVLIVYMGNPGQVQPVATPDKKYSKYVKSQNSFNLHEKTIIINFMCMENS